jgi:hypothetical protein
VQFTKSVQVESDNTNLDEFHATQVLTRDSSLGFQAWTFTLVGETPEGTGIYTLQGGQYGLCLADAGSRSPVLQDTCDPTSLAQRWIVNLAQEHTTIASAKNLNEVLQANGQDTAVTLNEWDGQPHQMWTLYTK